jgi:Fe-S cluster biogenesis protein NfuA
MTLKAGIERILKDRVPGVTEIVAVGQEDDGLLDIGHYEY